MSFSAHQQQKRSGHVHQAPRPLQIAAPIYLHARNNVKSQSNSNTHHPQRQGFNPPGFTPIFVAKPYQNKKTDHKKFQQSPLRNNYTGRSDPPSSIHLADSHDYSSVSDSCVTGTFKSTGYSPVGHSQQHEDEYDNSIPERKKSLHNPTSKHETEDNLQDYRRNKPALIDLRRALSPIFSDDDDEVGSHEAHEQNSPSSADFRSENPKTSKSIKSEPPIHSREWRKINRRRLQTKQKDINFTKQTKMDDKETTSSSEEKKPNTLLSGDGMTDEKGLGDDNEHQENLRDRKENLKQIIHDIIDDDCTPFDEAVDESMIEPPSIVRNSPNLDVIESGATSDEDTNSCSSPLSSTIKLLKAREMKKEINEKADVNTELDADDELKSSEIHKDVKRLADEFKGTKEEGIDNGEDIIINDEMEELRIKKASLVSLLQKVQTFDSETNDIGNIDEYEENSVEDSSSDDDNNEYIYNPPVELLHQNEPKTTPPNQSNLHKIYLPKLQSDSNVELVKEPMLGGKLNSPLGTESSTMLQNKSKIIKNKTTPSMYESLSTLSTNANDKKEQDDWNDPNRTPYLPPDYESKKHHKPAHNYYDEEPGEIPWNRKNTIKEGPNKNRDNTDSSHINKQQHMKYRGPHVTDEVSATSTPSKYWENKDDSGLSLQPQMGSLKSDALTDVETSYDGKEDESYFHDRIRGHSPGFHPAPKQTSQPTNFYQNEKFKSTPPKKRVAQNLSYLVSKTPPKNKISPSDDDDSIFVFPDDIDEKIGSNNFKKQGTTKPNSPKNNDRVGFKEDKNTVHHFNPPIDDSIASYYSETEEEYSSSDSDYTRETFDTRASYNTMYSKSMQSEVEDAMKDLFFIGRGTHNAPGRRKIKYRSDVKQWKREKLKMKEKMKAKMVDDPSLTSSKETSNETNLNWVWEYVEDGMNAVGEALGLANAQTETEKEHRKVRKESPHGSPKSIDRHEISAMDHHDKNTRDRHGDIISDRHVDIISDRHVNFTTNQSPSKSKSFEDNEIPRSPVHKTNIEKSLSVEADSNPADVQVLDGIEILGLYAAKALHESKGLVFNEKKFDLDTDVDVFTMNVFLPLGLLFQENNAGCWVTRVFRSGNATGTKEGGGVFVGDQLAAVNEETALKLKLDETLSLIHSRSNSRKVKLTFVRYIGPIKELQNVDSPVRLNNSPNAKQTPPPPPPPPPLRPPPPPPPRNDKENSDNESEKSTRNNYDEISDEPKDEQLQNVPVEEENVILCVEINSSDESRKEDKSAAIIEPHARDAKKDEVKKTTDVKKTPRSPKKNKVQTKIKNKESKPSNEKKKKKKLNLFGRFKKNK